MTERLRTDLRFGWTTGTCATASVYGAYTALVTGVFPEVVEILTPSGRTAHLSLSYRMLSDAWAEAGVIKDAGDDPDVTHGAEVRVRVEAGRLGSGVIFRGGAGIGVVTKSGLPIAVGEPAINPVPRQMMSEVIAGLSQETGGVEDVVITVSIPGGDALALKTWNPRLGIVGGLSILGTTGVVRPFSCSAWIASIHRGIDVARANGVLHIGGATGATSEKALQARYALSEIGVLDMGDFVGGLLKYLRRHPVGRMTIAGGFAKMVKLAQGHGDLHSGRSQVDFERLAVMAVAAGFEHGLVAEANSALDVLQRGSSEQVARLGGLVAAEALHQARLILRSDAVMLDVLVVGRDGGILGEAS